MTWNRPKPTGRPTTQDSNVFATVAARAVSDVVQAQPLDLGPEPKWAGAVRVLGLLLPSSWVWLTVCLWWAWRVLAMYARGEQAALQVAAPGLWLGLLLDAMFLQTLFATTRLLAALSGSDRNRRHSVVTWTTWMMLVIMACSAMLRIGELVHCAVERTPPTAAFWRQLIDQPSTVVLQGAFFACAAAALVTAAIGRYSMRCDLQTASDLMERLSPRKALALIALSVLLSAVTLTALVHQSWSATESDLRRTPELHAIRTFQTALDRRAQQHAPSLEP